MSYFSVGEWQEMAMTLFGFYLSGWLTGFLFRYVKTLLHKGLGI